MAVCPNCSRENPENAVFCEACGSLMSGAYADTAPVEPATITLLRKLGGSGAMLLLAILQTLATALSIPRLSVYTTSTNDIQSFKFQFHFPLMAILICIAFWMLYCTCKKPVGNLLSTGGLTLLRAIQMIHLILLALVFAVILAALGIMVVVGSLYDYTSDFYLPVFLIVTLLSIGAGALVVGFLYRLFAYRFLGSVKQTAKSGFAACRSAIPLAVFSILSGLTSLASAVLTFLFSEEINQLLTRMIYTAEDLLSAPGQDIMFNTLLTERLAVDTLNAALIAISSICGAICAILIGILALRYRAAMRKAA